MEGSCHALPYDSQVTQTAMRMTDTVGLMAGRKETSYGRNGLFREK